MITMENFTKLQKINMLDEMYRHFIENGDQERAEQLLQLYEKYDQEKWVLAFCGHFSAGKSTMINAWWGSNVLPTSPIPTSGNVVTIQKGNDHLRLWYKDGTGAVINESYSKEKYESYAWDSEEIERMDIYSEDTVINNHMILMDTPGVDSNDEAHRRATMKALHVADCIIFVMDYNHVQSEGNFTFVKDLVDKGKQIILIVNQIDKHNESELSLEDFKKSVRQSFSNWGVHDISIFYTSLKSNYSGINDFELAKDFIQNQFDIRNSSESLQLQLGQSADEHIAYLKREVDQVENDQIETCEDRENEQAYVKLHDDNEFVMNHAQNQMSGILENSLFITYDTRSACEEFISAHLKGYKKGWFSLPSKIQEEKKEQQERIVSILKESLEVSVISHLKELKKQLEEIIGIKENGTFTSDFITATWLIEVWKNNPILNNESLLHYTTELKSRMIREMKNQFIQLLSLFQETWISKFEKESVDLQEVLQVVHNTKTAYENFNKKMDEILQYQTILKNIIINPNDKVAQQKIVEEYHFQEKVFKEGKIKEISFALEENSKRDDLKKERVKESISLSISEIKTAKKALSALPLLQDYTNEVQKKIERLENSSYKIVLFGAFSAGKSSFINAFLGENVLPSSPNPTTAAICKIEVPKKGMKHKDFSIIWKTEEELVLELKSIFELVAIEITNLEEAIGLITKGKCDKLFEKHPVQGSFLQAFERGFGQNKDIVDFETALKTEEISCFIKEVTLYYDHPYTRKGYVFVDTPGVDSVNGRHTNVAFTYMKEADVLLYVTYYNHAFSKSDKEFLIQLGRMQDEFPEDKMYFLVNAIDLAKDEDEQKLVENYVSMQLEKLSIKNPRLFSISSHLELQKHAASGFTPLRKHLESFLLYEVQNQVQTESYQIVTNAKKHAGELYHSYKESEKNKQATISRYEQEQIQVLELLTREKEYMIEPFLRSEVEELFYYIRKRVIDRQQEFFKESFNPSRLSGSYRNCRVELELSLTEFLRDSLFDVEQELRATTFRIENYLQRNVEEKKREVIKEMAKSSSFYQFSYNLDFSCASYEVKPYPLKDMTKKFQHLLKLYRSSKHFFELRESKLLQEELQKEFSNWLKEDFTTSLNLYITFYEMKFSHYYLEMLRVEMQQIPLQLERWIRTFDSPDEIEALARFRDYQFGNELQAK